MQTLFIPLVHSYKFLEKVKLQNEHTSTNYVYDDGQANQQSFVIEQPMLCFFELDAIKLFHIFFFVGKTSTEKLLKQYIIFPFKFIVSMTVHLTKDVNQFIKGLHTLSLAVHLSDNLNHGIFYIVNRFSHPSSTLNRMILSLWVPS